MSEIIMGTPEEKQRMADLKIQGLVLMLVERIENLEIKVARLEKAAEPALVIARRPRSINDRLPLEA